MKVGDVQRPSVMRLSLCTSLRLYIIKFGKIKVALSFDETIFIPFVTPPPHEIILKKSFPPKKWLIFSKKCFYSNFVIITRFEYEISFWENSNCLEKMTFSWICSQCSILPHPYIPWIWWIHICTTQPSNRVEYYLFLYQNIKKYRDNRKYQNIKKYQNVKKYQ